MRPIDIFVRAVEAQVSFAEETGIGPCAHLCAYIAHMALSVLSADQAEEMRADEAQMAEFHAVVDGLMAAATPDDGPHEAPAPRGKPTLRVVH